MMITSLSFPNLPGCTKSAAWVLEGRAYQWFQQHSWRWVNLACLRRPEVEHLGVRLRSTCAAVLHEPQIHVPCHSNPRRRWYPECSGNLVDETGNFRFVSGVMVCWGKLTMPPERANFVLTTDIPYSEWDVLIFDRLDIESWMRYNRLHWRIPPT